MARFLLPGRAFGGGWGLSGPLSKVEAGCRQNDHAGRCAQGGDVDERLDPSRRATSRR
jgi:hypothetical protein